jgi:hypothetical protein
VEFERWLSYNYTRAQGFERPALRHDIMRSREERVFGVKKKVEDKGDGMRVDNMPELLW